MVKWKGVKKAQGNFTRMKRNADKDLQTGLENFATFAGAKVKENAVFVKGYSRGHLKRAITSGKADKGIGAHIKSPAEYSGWVEWGTRYMEAQPFFFSTIKKEVESSLSKFIMRR